MFGNLFDSPWKILIVAVVLIVLFGSRKLPYAARSLGQSMRILKKEVQGLHEDPAGEPSRSPAGAGPPGGFPPPPPITTGQPQDQKTMEIGALQQQLRDLQRSAAAGSGVPADVTAEPHPASHLG